LTDFEEVLAADRLAGMSGGFCGESVCWDDGTGRGGLESARPPQSPSIFVK
jgi:hypothetical protein